MSSAPHPSPPATPAPPSPAPAPEETFQPVAAVLAAIFPGAGHFCLGEARRGALIAAGVLGMFFGGLLIGGIGVVDRRDNFIWFMGQALVGPIAFGVDAAHQSMFKVIDRGGNPRPARPDEGRDGKGQIIYGGTPPYTRSLGRVHELGTLFATIAGMMNLICIIDASFYAARSRRRDGGAR